MFGAGFDLFSTLFPIFFTIIFVFVIGTMIATLVRGAKEKRKNDASPRLSVPATVVNKRTMSATGTTTARTIWIIVPRTRPIM